MCVYVCLCMCIVLVMGWVRETVVRVVLVYQSIRICTHTNGQIGRLDNKNHTFNHIMVFLKRSDILSLVKRLYSISHNACPLCLPPPIIIHVPAIPRVYTERRHNLLQTYTAGLYIHHGIYIHLYVRYNVLCYFHHKLAMSLSLCLCLCLGLYH